MEPHPRQNLHPPPPIGILVRCFNVMWWGVPLGTSTGIIMVEKWGDVATSPEEGTTSMEVLPATRAAGEPPRPRRILMTRLDVTGALAARVGWTSLPSIRFPDIICPARYCCLSGSKTCYTANKTIPIYTYHAGGRRHYSQGC